MRLIDMWFDSSVVECRNDIPEALGSHPGQARYFFTTCYILCSILVFPTDRCKCIAMKSVTGIWWYIVRQIDMWFGSSVVECRNDIPEALGSHPGQARYFFTTCYILCSILVFPTDRCKCIAMKSVTGIWWYIMRQIDMWFGSSVVERRDGISEALGSNPGRARYFFTTC